MNTTLTPQVINVAYHANPWLNKRKESFLSCLLSSYVEEHEDFKSSNISFMNTGKRLIPKSVVKFYATTHGLCPPKLYKDVWDYCLLLQEMDIQALWEALCDLMKIIPVVDQADLYASECGHQSVREKTCGLFTRMLWYAWRSNHCGMSFATT